MKYGLISDIHGNLEALTAVLEELDRQDVDEILCLGDVIGYGPNPEECLELVRRRASVILAGNHDHAALGLLDTSYFNPYARRAVEWTAHHISEAAQKFLRERPLMREFDHFTIVHATPLQPEMWNYVLSVEDALENFPHFHGQACFIGHSHVPVIIAQDNDGGVRVLKQEELKFQQSERYIINIGSVGQPRDGDHRAACAVYDDEAREYRLLRVEYDFAATQAKIRKMGLPAFLADRLALGQ